MAETKFFCGGKTMTIENVGYIDETIGTILDKEFEQYAEKNGVSCNYEEFFFLAKEGDEVLGVITGKAYYKEVHVQDLIVIEKYRKQHIGMKLLAKVEEFAREKNVEQINLTTYAFQAPEFYKKYGFQVEFIRENKGDPKLNKIFLVKYL